MDKNDTKIKEFIKALSIGTPLGVALKYSGIGRATYEHWRLVDLAYSHYEQEKEISSLVEGNPADIQELKEALGDDGANPETIVRIKSSQEFRKKAEEIHEIMQKVEKAQTKAIIHHLVKITDENASRSAVSAAQWYLERALPQEFGNEEKEEDKPLKPIEVNFVSNSEDVKKKIEDLEKEYMGEGKRA